jgi:hypothetical protein
LRIPKPHVPWLFLTNIEKAHPLFQARALYDYTRQTDEELSFSEEAQLEVFDTSDPDWILVGLEGEYGFAPANYIEIPDETAPSEPPPPSLPKRPTLNEDVEEPPESPRSPPGPAAAIAGIMTQRQPSLPSRPQYTPEESDEEAPTPSLPARPGLPPRAAQPEPVAVDRIPSGPLRGVAASPPYNRAAHSDSNDGSSIISPGNARYYHLNEMMSVMGKRKKMPTTLGINHATGVLLIRPENRKDGSEQTWTAEKMTHYSIEGKHVFVELVRPSKSVDFHAGAKETAQEILSALSDLAGAVRAEGINQEIFAGIGGQKTGKILYDFMAQGDDEVTVAVDDEVIILDNSKSDEWWQVRRLKNGKEGVVPSSYVEITGMTQGPSLSGINAGRSAVEQNRLEEERLAKESLRAARREEEARGSEVGPGMRLPERGSSLSARDSSNTHGQQRNRQASGRTEGGSLRKSSTYQGSNVKFITSALVPDKENEVSFEEFLREMGHGLTRKIEPDASKVRTWTDRSKSFSVEAQFLGLKDGKINLHKTNGVKIAVPIVKMSAEDLAYVERQTGVSLDEDRPLSDIKKTRQQSEQRADSSSAGATIERPQKPEYDWFQFFLSCDVAVGLCDRYAQTFAKDSMDESVLADVDATVLRNLGIREGDIIKITRFLDKKFGRSGGKRNVSFGEEETGSSGGLFSGRDGSLKNNTSKGRPAPAVQTNNVVDPKAFSQQEPKSAIPESVATPLASVPTPAKKDVDVVRSGFEDDAWDVKPSRQQPQATSSQPAQSVPAPAPAPQQAPQQQALTGSMQDLSLLTQALEPIRQQPTASIPQPPPQPQPQVTQPPQQAPPQVTPSYFQGIGQQQTGLPQPQSQQQPTPSMFNPTNLPQNIARQRPTPPQYQQQNQGGLTIPAPPSRPLSAPQVNPTGGFGQPPPLQSQMTGLQTSSGYMSQIAPPGQSLDDLRLRQQYTGFSGPQNPQNMGQGMGVMPQHTGFQYNTMQQQQPGPNGFQYPMQTGMQQSQFMNGGSPFADPRPQPFSPLQQQPTGVQSSFGPPQQYPQQYSQQTGVNSFLPPALQPTPTGMQGQNNGFNSSFNAPPMPPMPQQPAAMPLTPQRTGPPPPVRFGVTGDTKKLMPQATGRRANLSQASMLPRSFTLLIE